MPKLIRVTTIPLALNTLLRGQMRYMREHGFEVIMISSDGPEREEVIKNEGCPHQIIPMTRAITPFADLRSLWRMYRFFKKEKPDIVHSHTPKAGLIAMMAARFAGVKIRVHTIAGLRFMTATGMKRKLLVGMERLTGRFATQVWPNSRSLQAYVLENKLVSPGKLDIVGEGSSNGIDLSRFSPSVIEESRLKEIKNAIGYEAGNFYFLSVGRIVKDKGMDELSVAFSRLYEKNPKTRLILLGNFEDGLDPVSEASRKILMEHPGIIRVGWTKDVVYYMHLADVLVHPSYREGFPNVLLQAGAMDCPVICSRIPGNIDMVDHQKTGLVCEVRDAEGLFTQMEFALENKELLVQFSSALKEKVKQKFDQRIVHKNLRERYFGLMKGELAR